MMPPRERARLVLHALREVLPAAAVRVERLPDLAPPAPRCFDVIDRPHPTGADSAAGLVDGAGDELSRQVVAPLAHAERRTRSLASVAQLGLWRPHEDAFLGGHTRLLLDVDQEFGKYGCAPGIGGGWSPGRR